MKTETDKEYLERLGHRNGINSVELRFLKKISQRYPDDYSAILEGLRQRASSPAGEVTDI